MERNNDEVIAEIAHEKKIKMWKGILRKLRKRGEKRMRKEKLATKRIEIKLRNEEKKYRKEEREFGTLLKKDAARTPILINSFMSKVSVLEKRVDRLVIKNKLRY